jgi:Na+-transporting NADH:ubiquinone oxidoreductase subunit NqrB
MGVLKCLIYNREFRMKLRKLCDTHMRIHMGYKAYLPVSKSSRNCAKWNVAHIRYYACLHIRVASSVEIFASHVLHYYKCVKVMNGMGF